MANRLAFYLKKKFKNTTSKALVATLVLSTILFGANTANAAQITSFSDTLTRLKASTAADHTIFLVSPSGIAAGQSMTLTFGAAFTTSSIVLADIDFATGNSGTCTSATYTEQTLAASPSGATWGVTFSSSVLTLTSGTGTSTAGNCMRFRIGTNAVTGSSGTHQITNGTAGATTATVVANINSSTDTGTLFIPIITNDQVTISATVDPTISFSINNTSVSFGSLSSSTGRWATTGGGANASAATDPTAANTAHTLTVGTNASSGYTVTYNGALLTSGANTIAAATISADSDGAPGSNQFALCGKGTSGSPTVASGYVCGTNSDYNFVAGTTTTLASATAPASSDVVSVAYLANIASSKQAGTYTTTLTYVATGNF